MNTTRFTFLTSNSEFINKLKEGKVPMTQQSDFVYDAHIPTYYESIFPNFIAEAANDTKASVAVHIFYQDPGTGESSAAMIMFYEGKWL